MIRILINAVLSKDGDPAPTHVGTQTQAREKLENPQSSGQVHGKNPSMLQEEEDEGSFHAWVLLLPERTLNRPRSCPLPPPPHFSQLEARPGC